MHRLWLAALAFALLSITSVVAATPASADDPWVGWIEADEVHVRSAPTTDAEIVRTLTVGDTIEVWDWVVGEYAMDNNQIWAVIGPGEYVYTAGISRGVGAYPPDPPEWVDYEEEWIDVNLTQQIATAYWGDSPQRSMLISSGRPGDETPTGEFEILWRIYDEWMSSETLIDGETDYYSRGHVYYTQYLTHTGNAFHYNYWKDNSPFGVPTSHGCIGLMYEDAEWLWEYADVGTPVVIHY